MRFIKIKVRRGQSQNKGASQAKSQVARWHRAASRLVGEHEFAYGRQHVISGQLDKGLDEAPGYGWVLADMKQDWKEIFPA